MLYFSPLSVTDDKQLDRKHLFSFPQCRQGNMGLGGWGVFGDLVDVSVWGIVLCISEQIYTLRGGGWLRADVFAACSVCVVGLS